MGKPKISVIIPSYNSQETIDACLKSVFSQQTTEPYEVIVVDSSIDNTSDIIHQRFPTVKLVRLAKRTDQGTSRNIGLQEAQSELLFFIDADCSAPTDWFTRMLEGHQQGYDMVGGPIINANPHSVVSWAGYLLEFNDLLPTKTKMEVGHLPSGNVSYKRWVFSKYRGFPDHLSYALEDLLFHWNLSQAGVRMLFDPNIQVAHFHRISLRDYLKHQHKLGRGTIQLLRKTKLPGFSIVKHPFWATFLLPILPVVKFTRTSYRYFKWQPTAFFKRPLIFLLMVGGLFFWIIGFAQELYTGKRFTPVVEPAQGVDS